MLTSDLVLKSNVIYRICLLIKGEFDYRLRRRFLRVLTLMILFFLRGRLMGESLRLFEYDR
jgi:hypothetical protein